MQDADHSTNAILPIFGLGVFFAWFCLTGFVSPLVLLGSWSPSTAASPGTCVLAGMLCGAIGSRFLARHLAQGSRRLGVALPCCICVLAAPLLLLGQMRFGIPWYLITAGFFVSGTASAFVFALWHSILSVTLQGFYLSREAGGCALGAALCVPAAMFADSDALVVTETALACLNAVCVLAAFRQAESGRPQSSATNALRHVAGHLDRRFRVLFFAMNLVFGLSWSLANTGPEALAPSFGVACAVLVALCIATRKQPAVQDGYVVVLMRVCLASATVAFLLKAAGLAPASLVAQCLLTCSWAACWAVDISLLMQQSRTFGIPLAVHSATSMVLNNAGLLSGWLAGALWTCTGLATSSLAEPAAVLFSVALAICGGFLMPLDSHDSPDRIIARQAEAARQRNAMREAASGQFSGVSKAAKVYGLTEREHDVLVCLLQGYTAKNIASRLHISESTVKTHSYHLYRKTGVHSQQELMELIDAL